METYDDDLGTDGGNGRDLGRVAEVHDGTDRDKSRDAGVDEHDDLADESGAVTLAAMEVYEESIYK